MVYIEPCEVEDLFGSCCTCQYTPQGDGDGGGYRALPPPEIPTPPELPPPRNPDEDRDGEPRGRDLPDEYGGMCCDKNPEYHASGCGHCYTTSSDYCDGEYQTFVLFSPECQHPREPSCPDNYVEQACCDADCCMAEPEQGWDSPWAWCDPWWDCPADYGCPGSGPCQECLFRECEEHCDCAEGECCNEVQDLTRCVEGDCERDCGDGEELGACCCRKPVPPYWQCILTDFEWCDDRRGWMDGGCLWKGAGSTCDDDDICDIGYECEVDADCQSDYCCSDFGNCVPCASCDCQCIDNVEEWECCEETNGDGLWHSGETCESYDCEEDCPVEDECGPSNPCPPCWSCEDGECVPECAENSDCPYNKCCYDGCCSTCEPECEEDDDCPGSQCCKNGSCTYDCPPEPECAENSDCPPAQCCEGGECVDCPPEPECEEDDDCPPAQCCEGGECVDCDPEPPDGDDQCNTSSDCPEGLCCIYVPSLESKACMFCDIGDTCVGDDIPDGPMCYCEVTAGGNVPCEPGDTPDSDGLCWYWYCCCNEAVCGHYECPWL